MSKRLIDHICEKKIRKLAIIGLAKNAGKTITFNAIVKEAEKKSLQLALMSYGRDGEEIDVLTRKEKPRIYIPPDCIFVTASQAFKKSNLRGYLLHETGFKTLLGEVNIYRSGPQGGYIELVGVNYTSWVKKITNLVRDKVDLFLIDGALDRRSSAVSSLVEGLVLATGAVIGNTESLVTNKTVTEIEKLTLPEVNELSMVEYSYQLFEKEKGGIVNKEEKLISFDLTTTFVSIDKIKKFNSNDIKAIILPGALVDSFVERLLYEVEIRNCQLIVKDGTKVFLNRHNLDLLKKYNIDLRILHGIDLVAVTVNPVSPYGVDLSSDKIINNLKKRLEVPVYDLLSEDYRALDNILLRG